MSGSTRSARLGAFLNVGIGIVFIIAAVIIVIIANYTMRQQALLEARSKARIILDRNLATHTYFSQIMKPNIFAWSEPFRSKEYFDHTWMSSTFAIREIEKFFKSITPSRYSFKDAAINARNPENEADEYERAFLDKLAMDKRLEYESTVRNIDGKLYLVILRKGEVMEASCLRCHGNPKDAPEGLTDYYGSERSFNRKVGDLVHAVSFRIPLSEAYAAANVFSWRLSAILLAVLACLFTIQYWFYRRYLLEPLNVMRDKAHEIAKYEERLGQQIPQPFGRELRELATTFNEMSVKLRHDRDHLEELVAKRTEALRESENRYHSLAQTASDAIISINSGENVVFWNKAAETIFGYSPEEVMDKPLAFIMPERFRELHQEGLRRVISGGVSHIIGKTVEVVGLRKDGHEIPIEISLAAMQTKEGMLITGILRDVTERKQVEEEREKLIVQLQKALTEVKTLSGLLPICAHCKNIRDDKGYWSKIETYIHKHSDAEFSHGICPECAKKFYPDFDLNDDSE